MIRDIETTTEDGLVSKTGKLVDGTPVAYCHPHRRWEWDCHCGHVNSSRATTCDDCGDERKGAAAA